TTKYIWHTQKDSKTRSSHADRDGKVFEWAHPPEGGHPGEDYNCRCWAEPVMEEVDKHEDDGDDDDVSGAEGLTQEVISPVNDASYRWGNIDLLYHFKYGEGRAVTLEQIGLLGPVIEHARKKMFHKVENQIMGLIRKKGSGSFSDTWSNSYEFEDLVFALGGGTVKGKFDGVASQQGNMMHVEALLYYTFTDDFTDPYDVRELVTGSSALSELPNHPGGALVWYATDLNGIIYNIRDNWTTRLTGVFKI
ncbi:MAG: hypothetical protein GY804_03565, partial [Alphaproteobacteria bacterium]|nr:hypothetical protein [Alphaproteobacteria bacterium]